MSIGALSLRWLSTAAPVDPEFVPVEGPGGLRVSVQHDLVSVLRATGGRVDMGGSDRFRRPVIELQDGAFLRPDVPAWFRIWVGTSDGLLRREDMRAEGHIMDHDYSELNGPITIQLPQ